MATRTLINLFAPESFDRDVLPKEFFIQDTTIVARELLGCVLARRTRDGLTAGVIVETEAYVGRDDRACHSYGMDAPRAGHRTSTMFKAGGVVYVYLIYGMYHCFNVVTGPEGVGTAVLVRALMPLDINHDDFALMRSRRNTNAIKNFCSGPGKLCQALAITREDDGLDLRTSDLRILKFNPNLDPDHAVCVQNIIATPRINVDYAGQDALLPLRFVLADAMYKAFLSTKKFL